MWTGNLDGQYGNYNLHDVRGDISGPLVKDALSFGVGGGFSERDGYAKNVNTGHDIDHRSDWFGKGQLLFNPAPDWTLRFIISGERDRDGDYPLADLNALRANPHTANLRYEGYANRDIISPTLQLTHEGSAFVFSSTTGGVWWKSFDSTDIDYVDFAKKLGLPFGIPHYNKEEDFQFTEELRLGSAKDSPIKISNNVDLKWQSGLLFFTQNYRQETGETIFFNNRKAELDDVGVGGYAQATFTFFEKLDVFGGARLDYEDKNADDKYAGFGGGSAIGNQDFLEASPQVGLSYKILPKQTVYASLTRGYKAGGFNNGTAPSLASAAAPFGKEHSLSYEIGWKGSFAEDKLQVRAAAYYINWSALQLNHIGIGGQNFIANAGGADSKGLELEINAHPTQWMEVFGAFGYDSAHYHSDATDNGVSIAGRRIQFTPDFTISGGAELSYQVCSSVRAYVRGEAILYGAFDYDSSNKAGQDNYSIANFRAGVSGKNWYAEGFIRNAFDTDYVPIAISYAALGAPSGYVGESGAPMTFGIKAGVKF
ncbi:MAG: TonB-dependent receptor [Verrucomicrobiales bacterium]|nr:TonB-dependent receptor [Verrucomicrobiales bacterium]